MVEIDDQMLEDLYAWIDEIPLSRPKKDLKRDFSDGGEYLILSEHISYRRHYHLLWRSRLTNHSYHNETVGQASTPVLQ